MAYNRDYVAPTLHRRKPQGGEGAALKELDDKLAALPADASPDDIQNIVYEIGKNEAHGFENLRDWFKALYETLLGSSAGRSEEHTSELQSLMRISYAVFCLKKKKVITIKHY